MRLFSSERVYAEVYGFNTRSFRLMEHVGLQREGILRQHEIHNGVRQDMHIFGILKPEFYQASKSNENIVSFMQLRRRFSVDYFYKSFRIVRDTPRQVGC